MKDLPIIDWAHKTECWKRDQPPSRVALMCWAAFQALPERLQWQIAEVIVRYLEGKAHET